MAARVIIVLLALAVPSTCAAQAETLQGYAEWRWNTLLLVDGQVVTFTAATRFKGKGISSVYSIPLGHEVEVKGMRLPNGQVEAREIEAKPNGNAMFEGDVLQATNEIERLWVSAGQMYEPGQQGGVVSVGTLIESGPQVERARAILRRLAPPYVNADSLRLRVVDADDWNAAAMANGAIWIRKGLLETSTDDEIAIILGHELAHVTHEHTRRSMRRGMWGQLIGAAAQGALASVQSYATRELATLAAALSLAAWTNGYSRELEDQADRVGLRYAAEAGLNVHAGPRLWGRFRDKYGEDGRVASFFWGTHSRPSDRIRNIQLELLRNYADRSAPSAPSLAPVVIENSSATAPGIEKQPIRAYVEFYRYLGAAYEMIPAERIRRDSIRFYALDSTTYAGRRYLKVLMRAPAGDRTGWVEDALLK